MLLIETLKLAQLVTFSLLLALSGLQRGRPGAQAPSQALLRSINADKYKSFVSEVSVFRCNVFFRWYENQEIVTIVLA